MSNRFLFNEHGSIVDTTTNKPMDSIDTINMLNELNSFLSPFSDEWNSEENKHWDSIKAEQ